MQRLDSRVIATVTGASGSGSTGQVAVWGAANSLTGSSGLTYAAAALSVTGTITASGTIKTTVTSGPSYIAQGGSGGAGSVQFLNPAASGHFNWQIGAQINSSNTFEITPSTLTDGSLFTAFVFAVTNSGLTVIGPSGGTPQHQLNSALATNASGVGTLTNLPAGSSGNPFGYVQINVNGVQSYIPFWH